jgi:hypothetical protein
MRVDAFVYAAVPLRRQRLYTLHASELNK